MLTRYLLQLVLKEVKLYGQNDRLIGNLVYAYYAKEYVIVLKKFNEIYYEVLMKNKISLIPKKNLMRVKKYDTKIQSTRNP